MKQEMMGWQWHQLNHMQIICTSLWTDNHASNSPPVIFTGPTNAVKSTEGSRFIATVCKIVMSSPSATMTINCYTTVQETAFENALCE